MKRVQGNPESPFIECINPVRNRWAVRWDFTETDDGITSFMEETYDHRPTGDEIRALISGWINERTERTILSGFSYEGNLVWLSSENQFNYKTAYDLAVQLGGATLPVTFKFGTSEEPHYRTFETLKDLRDFYTQAMGHVQRTLAEGWKAKDSIDLSRYTGD